MSKSSYYELDQKELEMTETTTTVLPELTAFDRCDRCSAAAQVTVVLNSGGVLYFCGHHGRMHQSVLIQQGTIVGDLW